MIKHLIISIFLFSFYSCNDVSKCDCHENYYDMKRGKYDNVVNKEVVIDDITRSFEIYEKVVYQFLDEEDRIIRNKCLKLYKDDEVKNSECD